MGGYGFWIGLAVMAVFILSLLPPTRALLGWLVSNNRVFMPLLHVAHEVVQAHKVIIKNLGPRVTVAPSLDKKGTENKF